MIEQGGGEMDHALGIQALRTGFSNARHNNKVVTYLSHRTGHVLKPIR